MMETLKWIFLPKEFPKSVSSDYLDYQIWDTLQGFIGYIKGILLTMCFLRGLGIGQQDGDLSSAMFVWVVRDTAGVIFGLITGIPTFTEHFQDMTQLKTWRMTAEYIRILSGFVEIYASSQIGYYFLFLSTAVVIFNTVAGVMDSITRTTLCSHFAICNNMPDCRAKEGNQDKGVKIFGIPLALYLLSKIGNNLDVSFTVYVGLIIIQLYFNILAMNSLKLK